MNKNKLAPLLTLFSILAIQPSFSQATRTWVSGVGDDVNPCSRTAPCKTLAGAISKTAAGGEISILDPGGYGAITITKSITIDGGGIIGSILSSGTNGVVVNAPEAFVTLRNFSINGAGPQMGINGIRVIAVKKLYIENCTLSNFSGSGIDVSTTTAATDITINNVTINQAYNGISSTGPGFIAIDRCRIQGMLNDGIQLTGSQSSLSQSIISSCRRAVVAHKDAAIHLSGNTIANNEFGLQGAGTMTSPGNNSLFANKTPGITPAKTPDR